jgi:predicted SprT family Zn-dependent metalloprotease
VYHYAVEDLRVARSLMSDLDAFEFWMSKVYECDCGAMVIRDWDRDSSHVCRSCGAELVYKPVES